MKALVCGSRHERRTAKVMFVLDGLRKELAITSVVCGDALGVDTIAQRWAKVHKLPCVEVRALWSEHGECDVGPMRNQRMLDEYKPDVVIAFPGGRGTADMVRRAKKAGVEVVEIGDSQERDWTIERDENGEPVRMVR